MTIRAVIFDIGGVIVRTLDQTPRIQWEQRLGLPRWGLSRAVFETEVSEQASVGKLTVRELWATLAARLALSEAEAAQLQIDFWAGDRVDQELVEFIRSLRPRYRTALLTNAWPDARVTLTDRYRLIDTVDAVVISAEEGVAKPDPRVYLLAAERLGVPPNEAVFVDDVERNLEGARAVGMHAVPFVVGESRTTADFCRDLQKIIAST